MTKITGVWSVVKWSPPYASRVIKRQSTSAAATIPPLCCNPVSAGYPSPTNRINLRFGAGNICQKEWDRQTVIGVRALSGSAVRVHREELIENENFTDEDYCEERSSDLPNYQGKSGSIEGNRSSSHSQLPVYLPYGLSAESHQDWIQLLSLVKHFFFSKVGLFLKPC